MVMSEPSQYQRSRVSVAFVLLDTPYRLINLYLLPAAG
jgi:hypothetical protein